MSERPFEVARLDEVETDAQPGRHSWRRVRSHFGIDAFGINAWTATEAGQGLIEEHDEVTGSAGGHEELYLVTEGRARFTVDGEEIDAPAGTLVFVGDPASKRAAVAESEGTTVLVLGGKAGEPFAVSEWEESSVALRFFATGEYERAIDVLQARPQTAGVLFNLACAESLAGRTDAALEHLTRAIELDERFREYARTDSDLDPLRADPRFPVGP